MRVPGVAGVLLGMSLLSSAVSAQEQLAIRSDFLFYGDNTEFRNPFREGETIFGASARVAAEIGLNDRVTVSAGIFGNQRFGSEDSFELVRPVLALTVRGRRSSFVFGTLPALTSAMPPDRIVAVRTPCCPHSRERRSHSIVHTSLAWPGHSTARS